LDTRRAAPSETVLCNAEYFVIECASVRSIHERQLEVVYRQLARSTGFRGFQPLVLWLVSVAAAVTTAFNLCAARNLTAHGAALVWVGVAGLISVGIAAAVVIPALASVSSIARQAAAAVLRQFLPALGVGAAVTAVILVEHPGSIPFLPGLWLVLFGLGIVSLSPLIHAPVEYAAALYFAAAAVAYHLRTDDPAGFSLLVGVPFTVAHAITSLVLRASDTRHSEGRHDG
jgi:hypothetical protein